MNNLNDCNYEIKKHEPIAELAIYRTGLETNAAIQTTDNDFTIDNQFRQFKTFEMLKENMVKDNKGGI